MLTNKIIGMRIREFREVRRISQQFMVYKLQELGLVISRETLSKIENVSTEALLKDDEEVNLGILLKKKNFNKETLNTVDELQDIIFSFIRQKQILSNNGNKVSIL